jgi:hypothetical protein
MPFEISQAAMRHAPLILSDQMGPNKAERVRPAVGKQAINYIGRRAITTPSRLLVRHNHDNCFVSLCFIRRRIESYGPGRLNRWIGRISPLTGVHRCAATNINFSFDFGGDHLAIWRPKNAEFCFAFVDGRFFPPPAGETAGGSEIWEDDGYIPVRK